MGIKLTLWFSAFFSAINYFVKYSNGSCKPILDIYVLKQFQWYKEVLNPMSFDLSNCSLKIQDSIRIPIHKVGIPKWESQSGSSFWSLWVHSLTLSCTLGNVNVIPGLHFWSAPFHALAFVMTPKLGSWQEKIVKC